VYLHGSPQWPARNLARDAEWGLQLPWSVPPVPGSEEGVPGSVPTVPGSEEGVTVTPWGDIGGLAGGVGDGELQAVGLGGLAGRGPLIRMMTFATDCGDGGSKEDLKAVRAWAASNKIELSSRGRIPRTVIDQYHAAGN
jgi:hypothetical protein